MVAQRQDLTVSQPFNFVPTTLAQAIEYATIFANSGLCPEAYKGRPTDILIVWQMGTELGLDKMQSLRTLGCVNGIPFAWGDGKLALVKRHRDFVDMKEWFEGELKDGTLTAYCTIIRKNMEPVTRRFSIEDAKRAGLWGKKGTWTTYPTRMLQHRARGFAANDAFPDALFGLMSEEEAHSVAELKVVTETPKPKNKGILGLEEALGVSNDIIEAEVLATESWQEEVGHIKQQSELHDLKLNELKELIASWDEARVNKALQAFGVNKLEQLSSERIDSWVNHLKSKESK